MPLVQDRSVNLLNSSPPRYQCTTDALETLLEYRDEEKIFIFILYFNTLTTLLIFCLIIATNWPDLNNYSIHGYIISITFYVGCKYSDLAIRMWKLKDADRKPKPKL